MRIGTAYPDPGQLLYENVNAMTGWALHPTLPIDAVDVRIGDDPPLPCVLGYPAPDSRASAGASNPSETGFRCEFDVAELSTGTHTLVLRASAGAETHQASLRVDKIEYGSGPLLVTDLFIDVVGVCKLRCAMCPQGNLEGLKNERPMEFMPPEKFEVILGSLDRQHLLPEHVNLYNWGDPILHLRLGSILSLAARFEVKAILSSNLSVSEGRIRLLREEPFELLIVSISGMSQEVYEQNHRGGRIDRVLGNLDKLALDPEIAGRVLLKYLVFDHNRDEIAAARSFALERGFRFGAYRGAIPSAESHLLRLRDHEYAWQARRHVDVGRIEARPARVCPQESTIVVDHTGALEHCCVAWNHPYGQDVVEADLRHYLTRKTNNAFCRSCLSTGYPHYKHFEVLDSELLDHAVM